MPARAAASEERVADAHVSGGGDGIAAGASFEGVSAIQGKAVEARVCDERGQERVREVGMVNDIEEVCAQLQVHAFSDGRVLVDRQIPLLICRTCNESRPSLPK